MTEALQTSLENSGVMYANSEDYHRALVLPEGVDRTKMPLIAELFEPISLSSGVIFDEFRSLIAPPLHRWNMKSAKPVSEAAAKSAWSNHACSKIVSYKQAVESGDGNAAHGHKPSLDQQLGSTSWEKDEDSLRRQNGQWRWNMRRMRPAWRMCDEALKKLMTQKDAHPFLDPPDSLGLGPLTLAVVKHKLDRNLYFSPLDFFNEVGLLFKTSMYASCRFRLQAENLYKLCEQEYDKVDSFIADIVKIYDPNIDSEDDDAEEQEEGEPSCSGRQGVQEARISTK